MTRPAFRVGFDRYIDIQWADFAFELAQTNLPKEDKVRELRLWVNSKITGSEAAEKTANVLRNLWIEEFEDLSPLRITAFQVGQHLSDYRDKALLHYGMAINIFPIFREVGIVAGRLSSIQGGFTGKELRQRILEKHGNLGSIPRASNRILQSLVSWGLLLSANKQYRLIPISDNSLGIISWIPEAILNASPQRRLPIADLVHSPELLGVKLSRENLRNNSKLGFERDGTSIEFVKMG